MDAFRYLLGLVACAFVMGAAFDVYNTVTGATKWLRWLRSTLDFVFWVLSALLVYYTVFLTDKGQLRVYTLVILLLGYGLYWTTLHRAVVGAAFGVVRVMRAIGRWVFAIVDAVLIRPLARLLRLAWLLVVQAYRLGLVLENALFWLLAFVWKITGRPLLRWWPKQDHWQKRIETRWEEFWMWLSKRIRE